MPKINSNSQSAQPSQSERGTQNKPFFLWDYLKECGKPIVMYGTGDGADKILDIAEGYGLKPICFTATGDFPMKPTFRGYQVLPFEEVEKRYSGFVILICFGSDKPEVLERLYSLGKSDDNRDGNYEVFAPDVPVVSESSPPVIYTPEYIKENSDEIENTRKLFADEKSREVFDGWLEYRLSGDIDILERITSEREEILSLLKLKEKSKEGEFFIDAGAYKGDTVEEFIKETDGNFSKIITIEPEIRNHTAIRRKFYAYGSGLFITLNAAAWDEDKPLNLISKSGKAGVVSESSDISEKSEIAGNPQTRNRGSNRQFIRQTDGVKIDTICDGFKEEKPTYIKIDVEGAEERVINGAKSVIAKHRPKMLVSLYHRTEDMFKLPLLISAICPRYKFYLRKTRAVPGWEFQLIAII